VWGRPWLNRGSGAVASRPNVGLDSSRPNMELGTRASLTNRSWARSCPPLTGGQAWTCLGATGGWARSRPNPTWGRTCRGPTWSWARGCPWPTGAGCRSAPHPIGGLGTVTPLLNLELDAEKNIILSWIMTFVCCLLTGVYL